MKPSDREISAELVGPDKIAELLGVSRNTVLNWSRSGKIPCINIGKIYRYSVKKISDQFDHDLT